MREETIREIKSRWREILPKITDGPAKKKVNGEQSYICPLCGNGSGSDGDGLAWNPRSKEPGGLHCFKCGFSGDVIDLFMKQCGSDFPSAARALAEELNIDPDGGQAAPSEKKAEPQKTEEPPKADYTEYYKECSARLSDPAAVAYLQGRGISLETASHYGIGFDPAADPVEAPGGVGQKENPAPRIILPTSLQHYVARSIDPSTPKQYQKLNPSRKKGAGGPGFFNSLARKNPGPLFVTEGAFDALSILEAGYPAMALNSTSNATALIKSLENQWTPATLVLCLDNDGSGKGATNVLKEGLQRLKIPFLEANICGIYKDPNEALTGNREAFLEAVSAAAEAATNVPTANPRPDNVGLYLETKIGDDMGRFREKKKTGFPILDSKAGGLYTGLYCLAAISSLGKTSFALQLADNLVESGNEVLFFSLEQSCFELVSKSIARRANQAGAKTTSLQIREGGLSKPVLAAAKEYQKAVGNRLSIIEGNFDCNLSSIRDYVKTYMERNETRPVVFIDYLQILQPDPEQQKQSPREAVDAALTGLKRISREFDLTIIVISSVNRNNYMTPIDFESLKESGGIEYTCDVVWGLQLKCISEEQFLFDGKKEKIAEKRERIKEAKRATPREIELVCLKNRYGVANYNCYFDYYPAEDLFKEAGETKKTGRSTK